MLIGEPPRTQYDLHFSLLGIPVRIHPLFWLVALMLNYRLGDVASVATWIAAVFLAILVHEFGHALVMRAHGFRPWITLYGFGGLTSYDQGQARLKGSGPLGQILICLAGPMAGFLLATVLVGGLILAGDAQIPIHGTGWQARPEGLDILLANRHLAELVVYILYICIFWGAINLLPIYPLDGGQIAREILLKLSPRDGIRQSLMLSILAGGAMALFWLTRQDWFVAIFFGYLAYASYAALQAYRGRNPW
jgi:membrane-associated protease RseP (regulator of RpoE activity)